MKAASGVTEIGGLMSPCVMVEGRSLEMLCVLDRECRVPGDVMPEEDREESGAVKGSSIVKEGVSRTAGNNFRGSVNYRCYVLLQTGAGSAAARGRKDAATQVCTMSKERDIDKGVWLGQTGLDQD